ALQALWRLNIVHQDIKPHNILIDHDGRAVLSDFGLAALVPPGEYNTWREYSEAGTPAYMAPEILLRDHATSGHGAAVDVWSLG
ncbi:kinase-like domain-containing protein, partial [Lenzites betulinus]